VRAIIFQDFEQLVVDS